MRLTALAALGLLLPALASAATVSIALDDPALQRSERWGTQPARTQHKGSTLSFSFTGVAIRIILNTYHTYGVVTISLDGKDANTLDTYNDVGHIDSVCGLCQDGLSATKHDVVLTLVGPGQGQTGSGQAWMNIRSISYETGDDRPASPPGEPTPPPTTSEPPPSDTSTTPSPTVTDSHPSHSPSNTLSTGQQNNDPPQANRQSNQLNTAAIAGVVVASVAVAGILLLGALWLLHRRRRQRAQWDPHDQFVTPNPYVVYPSPQSPATPGSGSGKVRPGAAAHSSSPFFAAQTTSPTTSPVGTRDGDMREADGGVRAELAQIRADLSRLAHPPQYTTQ